MHPRYGAFLIVLIALALPARGVEPQAGELICPAPISTCQLSAERDDGGCPSGYRCACVPSCPTCTDCASQVCVADVVKECRTACDCSPGLTCEDGRCIAGAAPLFCCESSRCPRGQQCQHADGSADECGPRCRSACDCDAGLACVDGQCISAFVPVFCCEDEACPTGRPCDHRDGRRDRCGQGCLSHAWRCDAPGAACGDGRTCSCSASCPDCEDCGPAVCLPRGSATPYRCAPDGSCSQLGDRCLCVASCPACDDCALSVCVPSCEPLCDRRQRISSRRIDRVVELTRQCRRDADCVQVSTSSACRPTCGAWVSQRYAPRLRRLIAYLDQRYCSSFQDDGCPLDAVECGAERGACVDGLCTGVPTAPLR